MTIDKKRKVFLIVSSSPEREQVITDLLNKHYSSPTIYTANSGLTALQKISNAHVDIVLTENNLKMAETILLENANPHMAILVIGDKPKEKFMDEIVIGRLYFMDEKLDELEFSQCLMKALNFTSHAEPATFHL